MFRRYYRNYKSSIRYLRCTHTCICQIHALLHVLQRTISHVNEPARRSAQSMSNYLTGSATRRSAAQRLGPTQLSLAQSALPVSLSKPVVDVASLSLGLQTLNEALCRCFFCERFVFNFNGNALNPKKIYR